MSKHKATKGNVKRGVTIMRGTIAAGGAPKAQRMEPKAPTLVERMAQPDLPVIIKDGLIQAPKGLTRKERSVINKAAHAAKATPKGTSKVPTVKPKATEAKAQSGGTPKPKQATYRTKSGKKMHLKGCRFLKGTVTECQDNPVDRKLTPCAVCKPHLTHDPARHTRAVSKATIQSLRPCKVCDTGCSDDVRFTREHAESVGFAFTPKGTAFHQPDCRCVVGKVVAKTAPSKKQAGSKQASKATTAVHPLSREGQATASI